MMPFKNETKIEDLKNRLPAIFSEAASDALSNKYLYIPTYKIIQGLESQGFRVVSAKQQGSSRYSREHAKHMVYMTREQGHVLSTVDEEVPLLALTNSHNGRSSFKLETALFRLACSNGLLMPTSSLNAHAVTHKIGMENDVIQAAYRVVGNFDSTMQTVNMLKSVELNQDEKLLLAETAANIIFEKAQLDLNLSKGINFGSKLLTVRRSSDAGNSLWSVFNRVQENIIKGGLRIVSSNALGELRFAKTRPINSIERDSKLNKELMSLALKFAELKGAA